MIEGLLGNGDEEAIREIRERIDTDLGEFRLSVEHRQEMTKALVLRLLLVYMERLEEGHINFVRNKTFQSVL